MKKRKPANPTVTLPNRSQPESSTPAYHPTTEKVLSKVKEGNPYLPKRPSQKTKINEGKPTVTIAPGRRSTRDVFINRPQ